MKEIELIDKRGFREKHFLQENGEFRAEIYDENIHYKSNGVFKEIDNSLILDGTHYVNKANENKISFAAVPQAEILKIEKNNHYISFSLKTFNDYSIKQEDSMSKLVSKMKYQDVLKNIDISYDLVSSNVKENIYIKNKDNDIGKLEFIIDTDMELHLIDDKICTMDGDKCIFKFDTPYMIDSLSNINKNVKYSLNKLDSKYVLTMILDEEWLQSIASYPVIIDPTITNNYQNGNVYDTYIYPNDTKDDRNSRDCLKVGVERVNNSDRINRTLIKFDLPTLGTGSQVVEARLNLRNYPDYTNSSTSDLVDIHRVTSDWTEETANWNSMNDKYDSRVDGTFQCYRTHYTDENNNLILGLSGTDITPLVQKWYTSTPNYGIMLKLSKEIYKTDIIPMFFSKNNSISGTNPKPYLIISYRNQNGLEKYMCYQKQTMSLGSIYHNLYNGNLTACLNIGSTLDGRFPVDLKLIYNTNDVILGNNIGYGLGYRLNLAQTIKEVNIENTKYLELIDEDGTIHYFLNQKVKYDDSLGYVNYITTTYENTYFDEDGLNLVIEDLSDNYILKDKEKNERKFTKINGIGYLTEIKNINGCKNTINYDSNHRISKIIDADNSEINIEYNQNLINIINPDQTINLHYSNNNLVKIVSTIGEVNFTNNNNLIQLITDITGKKLKYEYHDNSPFKIKKILEYGKNGTLGAHYEAVYGFNSTTIIDSAGRSNTITFNNYGNPISTSTLKEQNNIVNGYGLNIDYGVSYFGETQYKNKVLKNGLPIRYVKNYLSNTSFESSNLNDILFEPSNYVSLTASTTCSNTGFKSLRITCAEAVQSTHYDISVPKGKYYTFSGYFKTDNKSMGMLLMYIDGNGNQVLESSEEINTSDFERYDLTTFYPEDAQSDLRIILTMDEVGYYYVDDVQLEQSEVANNYNMIENSDFSSGLNNWSQYSSDNSTSNVFQVVNIGGTTALKVSMDTYNSSRINQGVNVCGKQGDLFNISFWYKHTGLQGETGLGVMSRCNVFIGFSPVEEQQTDAGYFEVALNPNENEWQFYSTEIETPWDFNSVNISFEQEMNGNEFYITNINMFKDVRSVTYDYDEEGNIIKRKYLNNSTSDFKYDSNNQLIKITNPMGKNFIYEYDNEAPDRVIRGVSGTGISNEYEYDQFGNPLITRIINRGQIINPDDGIYRIRLKGSNNVIKLINNDLILDEDHHNHCKWELEKVTINSTDYFKIKHTIINNKYITCNGNQVTVSSYQNDNSLFELIKLDNGSFNIKNKATNKYLKNNNGNLTIEDLDENKYNYDFYFEINNNGQFVEKEAEYSIDGKRIVKIIDSNFTVTNYDIDAITGLTKSITNGKGVNTSYTYNNKKQMTSVSMGNKKIDYEYNSSGYLSKIKQDDKEYNYTYDEFSNVSNISIGDNLTLIDNNYGENNGSLISSRYGNDQTIKFVYDDFGRIDTIIKMDDSYRYKYGNNGDLLKIVSNDYTTKFTYDLSKKLTELRINNYKIKYNYDLNNNIIGKAFKLNNKIHTLSDNLNSDDAVINSTLDNTNLKYTYDDLGRIVKYSINYSYDVNYKYISNGKRTSMLIESIINNGDILSYSYDKLGNVIKVYNNNQLIKQYYYDDYNELIKENDYKLQKTIRYKYDKYGNMLFKKTYNLDSYNELNCDLYEYNNINWCDQLTKINNQQIIYDAIGNPISINNNINLSWINGRYLSNYSDLNNNLTITYKYNKDGIRTKKIINNIETDYYLENNNIIYEKRNNVVIYYLRNNVSDLIGFEYNGQTYYYIKNGQNDIIQIIDGNNNIVAKYNYDSWGNILSITDGNNVDVSSNENHIANINPFRYRSYYYDKEIKMYYLNSRYYNPLWCRFINADNYISTDSGILGYNMYLYCNNNPINYSDNDGHGLFAAIAVGVVLLATVVVANTIYRTSKAKKEIQKVQEKTNVPNKTKQLDAALKKNASTIVKKTQNQIPAHKLYTFVQSTKSGSVYDLKTQPEWENETFTYHGIVVEPQDVGNINFGYMGHAMGYDVDFLTTGAGIYQLYEHYDNPVTYLNCFTDSVCDDPRDTYYIRLGYNMYDQNN